MKNKDSRGKNQNKKTHQKWLAIPLTVSILSTGVLPGFVSEPIIAQASTTSILSLTYGGLAPGGKEYVKVTPPIDAVYTEYQSELGTTTWTRVSGNKSFTISVPLGENYFFRSVNSSGVTTYNTWPLEMKHTVLSTSSIDGTQVVRATFPGGAVSYDIYSEEYAGSGGNTDTLGTGVYYLDLNVLDGSYYEITPIDASGYRGKKWTYRNTDTLANPTPSFSPSITTSTNQNVSVSINYPSNHPTNDISAKEYRINGGAWTTYTSSVVMTANGLLEARSKDIAGNYSNIGSYNVTNIDKTPPASATFTPSTTSPTNQNVAVTINYPSDAYTKQYKIGSTGTWTTYTSAVSMSTNNTIYARSYDQAGNLSAESSYAVSNIDKVAPTTPTLSQNVTVPTSGDVELTILYDKTSDPYGGGLQYKVGSSGTWLSASTGATYNGVNWTSKVTVSENATVYARSRDTAGNYSAEGSISVTNIDKTPPANATFTPSTTAPTNQDVAVAINYPSDASIKQYKIGSTGTWTTYSSAVVVSANNTVYARSYDAVGNVSSETNYVVSNIDKVAPVTPTLSADVTSPTNGNVVVTGTFPADAVVKEYSLNDGAWTSYTVPITFTSNGKLEVRGRDSAGNYSAIATYLVSNIDKTAPDNATFSPSTTAPTNQNVSVTINYPADASVKQYKIGSTGTWTTYSVPISVSTDNTVIYARSFDAVGNVSSETSYTVTNIDKIAPTTPTVSADVTTPTNGNVSLTATFPADASVKEYSLNGGAWTAYTVPILMTANGTFKARARDSAGNYSAEASYTVSNIDKTAPANATFTPSTTAPTNQDVSITINYPSDASIKQYKISSTGTWTTYSAPISVSVDNTVIYARSFDDVGNVSAETSYTVTNIDKVAPTTPTITADVTVPTNGDVVLTASFPADATVKEYRLNSGTWTAYTTAVTVTSNGTFEARGKDSAGNYSSVASYSVTNIDKTAPANATLTPSTTSPTNQNVTVTIAYPADASLKEYKIGSTGTWTAYSTPVSLSANNTVYARSTDAVGNMSGETSLVVNNIDKTAPTTPTITADVTAPTNGNVVLTASFSADSTVKEYRLNSGVWTTYSLPVTMTANGTFEVRGKDSAGNYSAIGSYSVSNIDKTPPANATIIPSATAPTNDDVTVTISYPADASVKQYKIGSTGTWTTYTMPIVLSSNNTVFARSYDSVGNLSSETSLTVSNIDKVAPTTPTLSADVTTPTSGNVVVTATFPSDALTKEVRVNGGSWTSYTTAITMTANGKVEVRGTDNAGNVSTIGSYDVTNIDKTAPANATFTADKTAPTNQSVSVSINYPSDASVKQYKLGSTGTWTSYSTPVVLSSNNTVFARSYDAVGNVSNETSYAVTNIDKVAPTTPTLSADVTAPTNGNVVLTASFPSDASVKEYRLNGGTWTAYTSAITMTANGKMEVRATDTAGNISAIGFYDVTNIDKTPPANATLTPSTTAPTNQNVTVTIVYPSDANVKEYKIGSTGTWTAYSVPVALSSNNTVYARSTDEVGNVSSESSLLVNNIDKVAPTTPGIVADVTTPTNGNVTLTVSYPSDASVKEYKINGGVWTAYTSAVIMSANGKLEARATDNAGNVSAIGSYDVTNIDKTAPANATFSADKTTPTNTDVSVTISYPSDASVKQYKIGSTGTWTTYSSAVVLSSNNTVFARSLDAVGNMSSETSYVVSNIDKIAPSAPTVSADVTSPTNGNVLLTAVFPSDASVKEYRVNGGAWTAYTTAITMTTNGTFETRAKDEAGNYSTVTSYSVTNIDKTAPVKATLSSNTVAPTNQDVTVTISYPSDASVKEYKIGNGSWTAYTTPVVVSSNTTVYARSFDAVGNLSEEASFIVSNIDKVAPTTPTVSADVTDPTNGNVVLTASYPADASVKEYRLNGGAWTAYTTAVTMTSNGTFEARAKDIAGNYSVIGSYTVSNIDKTPPVNATLSADKTTPTNTNVTVSISYPADATFKQYKIGTTGTWATYTAPVVVSSNTTVFARSYDGVGNVSSETSLIVSNIDKVAPSQPSFFADVTDPTNGNVTLTVAYPSDAVIKEYRVNGGAWTAYVNPVVFIQNGTLEARAKDEAGNYSSVASYSVSNIDKVAPESATMTVSTTAPTNQDVTVTIAYPNDASVKQYKLGNGSWTSYTTPLVVSSNTTVYARSIDAVGNVSDEASLLVSNIDKVAPTVPTLVADKTSETNQDVIVTVSFPSDASVKEYRVNGGAWTAYSTPIVLKTNGTVEARAKDVAGNYSAIGSYTVSNIDKTAPIDPTFTSSITTPTNKDVSVTISFPADATIKQYKIGSTGTWVSYTQPVILSENTTVYARGFDAVGNASQEVSFAVTNIDKVAPVAPTLLADVTTPTNGNVVVTATFPADASVKEYRVNSGSWTDYTAPVTMTANGKVEVRATDNAGNVSAISSYDVTNIDKTAPEKATFSANTTSPTNQNVSVTIVYPSDATVKQYKVGSTGTWSTYTAPVVSSSNNTIYARSYDAVGNLSSESSYTVSNIDKVAPTMPTVSADVTNPTNGNVVLTATFPSDASVKEYRVNGGTWTVYSTAVTMIANGTFEVRARDEAGNYSSVGSYSVSNIDKTPPANATLTPSTTSPTNQDVNVTISYPVDASVKQYKVGSAGTWTAYTASVVVSSNTTVFARSYDAVGNLSNETSLIVNNIDKVAPITPSLVADVTAPTNGNVVVTATFPSDASLKEVRVNGGSWTSYTAPITMTANGKVEVRATDIAGNISAIGTYNVTNIDKVAPLVPTFTPDKTSSTNTSVHVAVNYSSDSVKKEVRVNGGAWFAYITPIEFKDNGVVEARATDNAGNVSDVSSYKVTNIDLSVPDAPSYTVTENQNQVSLKAEEGSTILYRLNDGEWTEYSGAVETEDGAYKVEFKTVDSALNESESVTVETVMYRDALQSATNAVEIAETEQTQEKVNVANEKVNALPSHASEKQALKERVEDVQEVIDVKTAIETAITTRNEQDVQNAKNKIDLLNGQNPIIIDILDDIQTDFERADILALVAKERSDTLSTKYGVSKDSYTALVNVYYAIKYTGDFMYKYAKEKVALVPTTDKHYSFVQVEFEELSKVYGQFTQERQQTDAEIKAESSVKTMETKYDPTMAVNTQNLINAVEDPAVRASLQQRLDTAKAKYEASLLAKVDQEAITSVETAERTMDSFYVGEAYKKVNVLTNETLKAELTNRLKKVEEQMAFNKLIADAKRSVELAEQYPSTTSYLTTALTKVNALPESNEKTEFQSRLDKLKAGLDQTKVVKDANSAVSLAQSMKTQYYVDKARSAISLVLDEAIRLELTKKVDAIVVK